MIVFIDRQHAGQAHRINARGAAVDINGDGKITKDEQEAHWTGYISLMLEMQLLKMGYKVIPISDGKYSERHARVNEYASMFNEPTVYLAMHLNAGGGHYGAMFYDHRSSTGKQLAESICNGLKTSIKSIREFKAIDCKPDNWTKNAFYTIKGVAKPVAICCEPIFMDTHIDLLNAFGASQIALGMAAGLQKWEKNR
jgi:hypothetical protein